MTTVRSIELVHPGAVTLGERTVPDAGPGEARLTILAVGICGSDLHVFHEGALGAAEAAYPFVMGHEAVGRVESVHDEADGWLVGRRVSIEPDDLVRPLCTLPGRQPEPVPRSAVPFPASGPGPAP